MFFFIFTLFIFFNFDTSGSMIPLSVSEILALDSFCDEEQHEDEQELGILVVGYRIIRSTL